MERLPSIRQLQHLQALAAHRHFGRAAQALGVTQSTLSASIHELEVTLGGLVAERQGRHLSLTLLGERVAEQGSLILSELVELTRQARAESAPLTGALRLGVIPTISPFLLPRLLPALRGRYPKLKLFLREDQTAGLVAQMERGELDLLLLALPCDCAGHSELLAVDPLMLVMRKDHPLAAKRQLPADLLQHEKLLTLQDGHCLRDQTLLACGLRGGGDERYAATSLHTLVQMVDNGLGLTLLPKMAIDAGILAGTSLVPKPFLKERAHREIALLWREQSARHDEFSLLARECKRLFRGKTGS